MMRRMILLCTTLALMTMAMGCATSTMKHVQAIDSSEASVKFLYNQYAGEEGYKRGMIECDLEGEELQNCRELEVIYRD